MNIALRFLVVFFALTIGGCDDVDNAKKLRIGTFSEAVDYAPLYVAAHFNWLDYKEVKAELSTFNSRAALGAAVENDEVDFIAAAAPPVIITRAQGIKIKILDLSCTLRQEILVRTESEIHSVADLGNKSVAVLSGTSSHYGVLRSLETAQIDQKTVSIIDQPPPAAESSFHNGEVDAWAVWPPWVEKQQVSGAGRVIAGGDAVIQSVIAVSERAIERRPALAHHLKSALSKAKRWMVERPEEAQAIVANRLSLDTEIIRLAWPKHDWSASVSDSVRKDVAQKIKFLEREKLLRDDSSDRLKSLWVNH